MHYIFRRGENTDFKYARGATDLYGRVLHPSHELYFFLGGEGVFTGESLRHTLTPYALCLIPRGHFHQVSVSGNADAYERCVINLHGPLADGAERGALLSEPRVLCLTAEHRITRDFLHLIQAAEEMSEADFARLLNAAVIDILLSVKYTPVTPPVGEEDPLCTRIMAYINQNYAAPFSLSALARDARYSVSRLSHAFKARFGIGIKQYLLQKRLQVADALLKQGLAARTVGEQVGFGDYTAFFRAYKRHYGSAPTARRGREP